MQPEWRENDALFREQLAVGHSYAHVVAGALRLEGFESVVTPMEVRDHIDQRDQWADEWDITVEGVRLEVKSRNLWFTGPHDYPYPTAIFYAANGWRRKTHRPAAVVLVSQHTGGMAVVRVSDRATWTTNRVFDNVRRIDVEVLETPTDRLASFAEFVGWLRWRASVRAAA